MGRTHTPSLGEEQPLRQAEARRAYESETRTQGSRFSVEVLRAGPGNAVPEPSDTAGPDRNWTRALHAVEITLCSFDLREFVCGRDGLAIRRLRVQALVRVSRE